MLRPDVQAELDDTWEPSTIIEAMTAFKEWRASAEKARTQRTERLEGAITPQGVGAPATTEADESTAMLAGWKSVRG